MSSSLTYRWLLRFLCRHGRSWPGVWRLNLFERAVAYRFSESTLQCKLDWFERAIKVHANDIVGNWIYFFGSYEGSTYRCIRRLVKPGDKVLDLGAHVGVFSLVLAEQVGPTGRVYAVEPSAGSLKLLKENLRTMDIMDRVVVENCAVSDFSGEADIFQDPEGRDWGGRSLDTSYHSVVSERVAVRTLDSLWESWGRPTLSFVKLDVEGSESNVLKGAERLFSEAPPQACIVEFNSGYVKKHPERYEYIWKFFLERSYIAHDVKFVVINAPPAEDADVVFVLGEMKQCPA